MWCSLQYSTCQPCLVTSPTVLPASCPSPRSVKKICVPWLISNSVMVCHRSIATLHPWPTRRQLRSMTSFSLSPSSAASTDWSLSSAKEPDGNKKEVMMTYCGRWALDWMLSVALLVQHRTLSAPASIHCFALESLIPPPICSPPGQTARASRAASSLPGPSMMTCPPRRLCFL